MPPTLYATDPLCRRLASPIITVTDMKDIVAYILLGFVAVSFFCKMNSFGLFFNEERKRNMFKKKTR